MSAEKNTFIIVAEAGSCRWLNNALHGQGEIVSAEDYSLEWVMQAIDATGARLVFVNLSRGDLHKQTVFLEGLLAAKPLLPVIVISETADQTLLLAALRVGARDFLTPELRPEEVVSAVRHALDRTSGSTAAQQRKQGWTAAVLAARPGNDAPMFASHLALAIKQQSASNKVLLLDLGMPAADTLLFLGVKSSYSFVDAIGSMRRFDTTLVETAFGKHKSGIYLLSMPEDRSLTYPDITSADIYVLLGTLRRYFTHIVINLGGVPASDFLYLPLGWVDRILLVAEQSLPSCKQNMALLAHLREHKMDLSKAALVLDHYLGKIPPDAASVAKGMNLPLLATLPSSGMARLAVMNSGESMFDMAPRDVYAVAMRNLTQQLLARQDGARARPGWLQKLRTALGMTH